MAETLSLAVWCAEPAARFDTRKFQVMRRDALLDALGGMEGISVLDWGKTEDRFHHQIVDLVIGFGDTAAAPAAAPALARLGQELSVCAASKGCAAAVITLLARLYPKQAAGEFALVQMHLLNNCVVALYPAGTVLPSATLRLFSPDGAQTDLPYDATAAEAAAVTGKRG